MSLTEDQKIAAVAARIRKPPARHKDVILGGLYLLDELLDDKYPDDPLIDQLKKHHEELGRSLQRKDLNNE